MFGDCYDYMESRLSLPVSSDSPPTFWNYLLLSVLLVYLCKTCTSVVSFMPVNGQIHSVGLPRKYLISSFLLIYCYFITEEKEIHVKLSSHLGCQKVQAFTLSEDLSVVPNLYKTLWTNCKFLVSSSWRTSPVLIIWLSQDYSRFVWPIAVPLLKIHTAHMESRCFSAWIPLLREPLEESPLFSWDKPKLPGSYGTTSCVFTITWSTAFCTTSPTTGTRISTI